MRHICENQCVNTFGLKDETNIARVKYLIVTSHLHLHLHLPIKLVNSVQTSHQPTRTQSEKTI